jgi:hypothetical protein
MDFQLAAGQVLTFALPTATLSLAGGLMGFGATSALLGLIAVQAGSGTLLGYHFGVPQFTRVDFPPAQPGEIYDPEIGSRLPPVVTPYGNVSLPNITQAELDVDAGTVKLTLDNPDPGQFVGTLEVRALLPDGSYRIAKPLEGDTRPPGNATEITVSIPTDIALAHIDWQVVRLIPTGVFTGSGNLSVTSHPNPERLSRPD